MKQIIIHHSASDPMTTVAQINEWHKARDFTLSSLGFYVGYHYVITFDGVITQTRKDYEVGCHCVPNDDKIGICLTGNFERAVPTPKQLEALTFLLNKLKCEYFISDNNVLGHNHFKATECPGTNLSYWLSLYKKVGFLKAQIELIRQKIIAMQGKVETYRDK